MAMQQGLDDRARARVLLILTLLLLLRLLLLLLLLLLLGGGGLSRVVFGGFHAGAGSGRD